MTHTEAIRLSCEAALLEDSVAAEFLLGCLEMPIEEASARAELILALGWVAAEKAIAYVTAAGINYLGLNESLTRLGEAQRFCAEPEEIQASFRTLTALLPQEVWETRKRVLMLRLATVI